MVIEPGTSAIAFGVVVPDLPGCFSAGDKLDEAMAAAEEAAAWVDADLDAGRPIPPPSSAIERVKITLPRRVLRRLDALARAAGESRSGYIATMTLEEPRRGA
jgi:predicted RNase H-like HicB family nuclease